MHFLFIHFNIIKFMYKIRKHILHANTNFIEMGGDKHSWCESPCPCILQITIIENMH